MSFLLEDEEQREGSTETNMGEEQMFKDPLKKHFPEDQPGGATKTACADDRGLKPFPKEPPGGSTEHTWPRTAPGSGDWTYPVKMSSSGGGRVQTTAMLEQTAGAQETDRNIHSDNACRVSAGQMLCDVSGCQNPGVKACKTCRDSYCMICIKPHYSDPDFERHQLQDLTQYSYCVQHNRGHGDIEHKNPDQEPQGTHSMPAVQAGVQLQVPSVGSSTVNLSDDDDDDDEDGSQKTSDSFHTDHQMW